LNAFLTSLFSLEFSFHVIYILQENSTEQTLPLLGKER